MLKDAARLCALLLITGSAGVLGWVLYPAADHPPSSLLGRVQLAVDAPESSSTFSVFPTVHVISNDDTRLDLAIVSVPGSENIGRLARYYEVSIVFPKKLRMSLAGFTSPEQGVDVSIDRLNTRIDGNDRMFALRVSSSRRDIPTLPVRISLNFSGRTWTERRGTWLHINMPRVQLRNVSGHPGISQFSSGGWKVCPTEQISDFVAVTGTPPSASTDDPSCGVWDGAGGYDVLLRSVGGQDKRDEQVFMAGLFLGIAAGGGIAAIDLAFDLRRKRHGGQRSAADPTAQKTRGLDRRLRVTEIARRRRRASHRLTGLRSQRRRR